jgi:chromosome segregation protein
LPGEARARRQSHGDAKARAPEQIAKLERQLTALDAQTRDRRPRPRRLQAQGRLERGQQLMAEITSIEGETLAAEKPCRPRPPTPKPRARLPPRPVCGRPAQDRGRDWPSCSRLPATAAAARLDQIKVEAGQISARRALGDDLDAPVAADAPVSWRMNARTETDPALPAGVAPLLAHVEGRPS